MLGWLSILSSLTSRNAVMGKPSFSLCMRIFLSATMLPVRFDFALETTPNVPSPSFSFITSYSEIFALPRKRRWVGSVMPSATADGVAPDDILLMVVWL